MTTHTTIQTNLFGPESTFRLADRTRFRTIDDQGVVIMLQSAEVLVLNAVGARTLELLSDGQTLKRTQQALETEYDASAERIERDTTAYLSELIDAGALEPVEARL